MKQNRKTSSDTLRRVLRYIRPHLFLLLLSLLFSLFYVAATLYIPILTGDAIDLIIGEGAVDFTAIGKILVLIAITMAVGAFAHFCSGVANNRITYGVVRDLRRDAFRKLQKLPLSYLDSHPHGDIVSRMITDADTFADGLLMGFNQFFSGIVTLVGTLVFMLSINVKIALVVVLLTPASLLLAAFIARRTQTLFRSQSQLRSVQTGQIGRIVGEHKVIATFGRENAEEEIFEKTNRELKEVSQKATFFSSLVNPSTRLINSAIYAAVALLGALTAGSGGSFTVGQLSCLLSYSTQYSKPFNEISGVITELQNALVCAERIFDLLDRETEIPDAADAAVLETVSGDMTLSDVSFSYDKQRELIRDLSLSVKAGQRVAIVGPTGCGKTTIINLLMRFYDVDGGSIAIDGKDIRDVTRESLRRQYGMVLQDTWIRSGTVRDNLTYGRPDATEEEIVSAAKASHCHRFIMQLPNGYDTVLGEGGGTLSQGQKQLLSIARVMLALPPVLILDEATSSIDTRTELKIQSAFAAMMKGRTSFIVAHRLPTIKEADLILVMKDGRIMETGNHKTLLEKDGFYRKLYDSQFAPTDV